jgi:signal transduction histidine kinase
MSNSSNPARAQQAVRRRLTLFYSTALTLIAIVVFFFTGVRTFVLEPLQENHATVALLAGNEERDALIISRDAQELVNASEEDARVQYVPEMRKILDAWNRDHTMLSGGDFFSYQDLSEASATYERAKSDYQVTVDLTANLIALYDRPGGIGVASIAGAVDALVAVARSYITKIDPIVGIADAANDVAQAQGVLLERVLLGAILATLLAIALLVFRPAIRQVGLSIAELERAEGQQRELAALKDQFIIDANHELRTPIMALYNNLELLSLVERRERDDPAMRKDLIQQALTAGDGLLRLLRNVLDVGALDSQAPRVTPTRMRLEPLVRLALETFDPREIGEGELAPGAYQARAVTMNIPSDMIVWCDEGRLRQVLINLISNALKYSAAGSPIVISAQEAMQSSTGGARGRRPSGGALQYARVSVRDQGLGVPRELAPQLFQRFVRLPRDIAGPVRGTGVGLYLCRTYVEAMGGEIGVESSGVPGEGSTFSFTLPVPGPDALEQAPNDSHDQNQLSTSVASLQSSF